MAEGTLYIGNRRYSSWSMRGWLAVRLAGLDVEEVVIPFTRPGPTTAIRAVSPTGLVPCLAHHGALVWESLAICEYCAEQAPALWPADPPARAQARSVSAEMHAGFAALREAMWMNLGADFAGRGRTPGALADIARIEALWADARTRFGGPFLFGAAFTAADAMFAPVVARFLTWRPELSADGLAYCAAVRAHPLVVAWYDAAAREPRSWLLPDYEAASGEAVAGQPRRTHPGAMPPSEPASKPQPPPPPMPKEVGGPSGPEPTRYGDWERKGRCIDF